MNKITEAWNAASQEIYAAGPDAGAAGGAQDPNDGQQPNSDKSKEEGEFVNFEEVK
jgi:molecular chaperone DnaK